MAVKKGLGKGLGALFETSNEEIKEIKTEKKPSGDVLSLKIIDVEPNPDQPRSNFDKEKLQALADSIKTHGVIEPILVSAEKNGMYRIIAGERRWRASKLAGLKEIPAIIKDYDEKQVMEIALVENLQREDLDPIEEAEGYKNLMEAFGMTQDEVAKRVGKSRSAVANSLRLNNLEDKIKKMVSSGELSQGHARTILGLTDKKMRLEVAELAVKKELSVRELENLVSNLEKNKKKPTAKKNKKDIYFSDIEKQLEKSLGTKVTIRHGKENGKIIIDYFGNDELERLIYELKK